VTPTRAVSCRLELNALSAARLVLQVAVASGHQRQQEELSVTLDGAPVEGVREVATTQGGRLHIADVGQGTIEVDYRAVVEGSAEPTEPSPDELFSYLRPSRYAESDKLFAIARREITGSTPHELVPAAASWVQNRLLYIGGSSRVTDGAVDTLLAGAGVCRDYAHLLTALLRAHDVPARLVGVYAPGLFPMDFHAVVEAWLDDAWYVFDATGLAPRQSLVRMSTGRDAADTAFLTTHGGNVQLVSTSITATASPDLPVDDPNALVALG
jgi:transglutaminase-like putative cysteine protease